MPYSHPQSIDRQKIFRQVRHLLPGALLLSMTAGFINAVVLGFFRTPVSHMTGAVSHFGLDLALGREADAFASASIILGFVSGSILAGLIVGALHLVPGRRYGVAMLIEGALLSAATAFILLKMRYGLPLVAMACGLQNAMSSSYCGLVIRTTHVTGLVTDIGVLIGHWIRHRQVDFWKLRFLGMVFLSFALGGLLGALADRWLGPWSLGLPAFGMTVAGGIFWFITHRGVVDLMQEAMPPSPPRTGMFPGA
jgi:uncharacterized membrane protein YoaK (UPF0700 family)